MTHHGTCRLKKRYILKRRVPHKRTSPINRTRNDEPDSPDIVRALRKSQTHPYGRFDTVVVLVDDSAESTGLAGW